MRQKPFLDRKLESDASSKIEIASEEWPRLLSRRTGQYVTKS